MNSMGSGDRKSPCPKCRQFVELVDTIVIKVDTIEKKMTAIKKFYAENEWILIENATNINKMDNPAEDLDVPTFEYVLKQATRFDRLLNTVIRQVEFIESHSEGFRNVDKKHYGSDD